MAEIGRAAQAAVRSTTTSLVRVAPIRPQPYHNLALASILSRKSHMSTTSCMRSSNESTRATHISTSSPSRTQQQNYSSFNWGNPSRPPRTIENIADLDIRKPTSSSYDFAFRGQKDGQRDEEVDSDLAQDFASSIDITDLQSSKQSRHTAPVAPRAQIRLVPRTGRTVYVGSNVDIARSFKLLAVQVGQNKIRRDFQQQKFHERPGKKRKRLASERWRTRFRIGFKATISRVRELTAQGCWACETRGTSGFIDYGSNSTRVTNVEFVRSPPPQNATLKTSTTVDMTPTMHSIDRVKFNFANRTSTQPGAYRDVGVTANHQSSFQPVIRGEFSGSKIESLQAKHENKGQWISIEDNTAPIKSSSHNQALTSRDGIHQIDLNIGQSRLHEQQLTLHEQGKTRNEAEHKSKILELQDRLKDAQAKIQNLFAKHEEQRSQLDKAVASGPSEQWTALALRSNELLGRLDAMAHHINDSIHSYLEKYDQHLSNTASYRLPKLQRELESNLGRLNEETRRKGEFEENLLQEYKNTTTWYQHEVRSLQGQKSEKEALIEQLRAEFLNERQRLYDEHRNELNAKAIEHARLMEKQYRKQERLSNWYNRRMDQKNEEWQTRLVSVQSENAHLINERDQERREYQKQAQKADERIQKLLVNLSEAKDDFNNMSKLKQELQVSLSEGKRSDPIEYQLLLDKIADRDVKIKDYLEEIKQLRDVTKSLNDIVRNSKENLEICEREVVGYKQKLEDTPREIQELQESHHTTISLLKEDFMKRNSLLEEDHRTQISIEREKLEGLERLVESLRNSKHQQSEQHCKTLEDNTRKWHEDINKRRIEWQKELDQSYELVREAKATAHSRGSKIEVLEQDAQRAQSRIITLTAELDQIHDRDRDAKATILSQTTKIKALELEAQETQRTIQSLTSELDHSYALFREVEIRTRSKDARIELLKLEAQEAQDKIQSLTSQVSQAKETRQVALTIQRELELSRQEIEKNLTSLQQSFKKAKNEKITLVEQVAKLEQDIQNTSEQKLSLETNLRTTRQELAAKVREASTALKESEQTKEQLTSLQSKANWAQKQLLESHSQNKQKDFQLERLNLALKNEQIKREELGAAQKTDRETDRSISDLTTQLSIKTKQLENVELSYGQKITEQNKLLLQRNKTIRTLEEQLASAQQERRELEETMKQALMKEETKRSIIFNEFQKLRKEIRVMCRIRPSTRQDGPILDYATSEGKFHSKPAGLEIISQKSMYGTATQVQDRTKHYKFDRVFEADETNEDVWLEISQFVQSFIEGRQVTIFCYGQTATGKTYTMSNSERAVDANGEPILTNEGIMPRSKALIFEEANRRREKGWFISIRGCCYEVYLKEIRQLLPNRQVKTKSLDPTEPPWWHVRDPEYQRLNSVEEFDEMFDSAMESRTFAETTSNSSSSRSHFILYLEFEAKSPTMKKANKGSLCLVDLAGSEDPHKASALDDRSMSRGSNAASMSEDAAQKKIRDRRLREGIAINQSLRVLRKSIPKIRNPTAANGKPTLEGGDEESSTLAKLLGPCLGRESMVLMFVMINLSAESLSETKATLESGKEIAEIRLSPKKTLPSSPSTDDKAETLRSPAAPKKPGFGKNNRFPKPQGR